MNARIFYNSAFASMRGFTLIELSIVIVIIGLVAGTVMVGQNLLFAATARNQMKQMESLEMQINAFRTKYDCWPGDCQNATTLLGATFGGRTIVDGDGNGVIRSSIGAGGPWAANECLQQDVGTEIIQLFLHLNAARMGSFNNADGSTASIGRGYPYNVIGTNTGMYVTCMGTNIYISISAAFLRSGNILMIGTGPSDNGRIVYNTGISSWGYPLGISSKYVAAIDIKTDDGLPSSGRFGIVSGSAAACAKGVAAYPGESTVCDSVAGKWLGTGE